MAMLNNQMVTLLFPNHKEWLGWERDLYDVHMSICQLWSIFLNHVWMPLMAACPNYPFFQPVAVSLLWAGTLIQVPAKARTYLDPSFYGSV